MASHLTRASGNMVLTSLPLRGSSFKSQETNKKSLSVGFGSWHGSKPRTQPMARHGTSQPSGLCFSCPEKLWDIEHLLLLGFY